MEVSRRLYDPAPLTPGQILSLIPLHKGLDGSQTLSGRFGEQKLLSPVLRIEPQFLGCTARSTPVLF